VSGGQDDVAYVWDPVTGSVKFSCLGHTDSVHCVAINNTNAWIATADMGGLVQVWKSSSGEKVFDYEVDDIHWISWHPMAASVILVGTDSGAVWMFNVTDNSKIKTFQGPSTSASKGKVTPDGTKLLVGYDDGSIRLWDLKSVAVLHTFKDNHGHSSTVTSIDFKSSESTAETTTTSVTSSTDGTVQLTNLTTGRVITKLSCGQIPNQNENNDESEDGKSVESVGFCSSHPILLTATVSGVIEVWEISSFNRRHYFIHQSGISKVVWHPLNHHQLISSGLDGVITTWDARSGQLVDQKVTHGDQVLDFDVAVVVMPRLHENSTSVRQSTEAPGNNSDVVMEEQPPSISAGRSRQAARQEDEVEKHVMLVTASEDTTCRVFCLTS